jgi:hypothetical protein
VSLLPRHPCEGEKLGFVVLLVAFEVNRHGTCIPFGQCDDADVSIVYVCVALYDAKLCWCYNMTLFPMIRVHVDGNGEYYFQR